MSKSINVRIDDDLRRELDEALKVTGLGETQLVRAAIEAFVEEVKRTGEVRLPLAVVGKKELEQLKKLHNPFTKAGEKPLSAADAGGRSVNPTPSSGAEGNPAQSAKSSAPFSVNEDAPAAAYGRGKNRGKRK